MESMAKTQNPDLKLIIKYIKLFTFPVIKYSTFSYRFLRFLAKSQWSLEVAKKKCKVINGKKEHPVTR